MTDATMTVYAPARPGTGDRARVLRGERHYLDRDTLALALREPDEVPPTGKHDLPLVALATFRDERRRADHTEAVYMLGLDDDHRTVDPAAWSRRVHAALGGVEVYAHSTASSSEGAYRMRALVPYDRPATGDEHRASWALVARVLARAGIEIDRACSDPSRGYYLWAVPPSGVYYQCTIDGAPWPVALAAGAERERQARSVPARAVSSCASTAATTPDRARRYVATMPPAISGAGGHAALWRVARVVVADFALGDTDAMDVLREYSARCSPPWSERELAHKMQSARTAHVVRDMRGGR